MTKEFSIDANEDGSPDFSVKKGDPFEDYVLTHLSDEYEGTSVKPSLDSLKKQYEGILADL